MALEPHGKASEHVIANILHKLVGDKPQACFVDLTYDSLISYAGCLRLGFTVQGLGLA